MERKTYKRADYIQSITATELQVQDWTGLMTHNERKIHRLQTFKRVLLYFGAIVLLGSLIMGLITL